MPASEAPATTRVQEVEIKLAWVREALAEAGRSLCRLRGSDWFAWATAGGSSTVLMTAETGVAEVIVGLRDAFVLTDHIEAERLRAEQLGEELAQLLPVRAVPWGNPDAWETAALATVQPSVPVLSDRPGPAEEALPEALLVRRRTLLPAELARFRHVGRAAAEAVTAVLLEATPQMTELELAALAGAALRRRGLDDALALVAGQRRLPLYRHPTPQEEVLGDVALLAVCARGHGLVASLTRFVSFGPLPDAARAAQARVRAVEAAVLAASVPGTRLMDLYDVLAGAYRDVGDPGAVLEHHQGGLAGYQAREAIATPGAAISLNVGSVLAWNPSVRGAKIEDTIALTGRGLEVLTLDPAWPQATVAGLPRPLVMERTRP